MGPVTSNRAVMIWLFAFTGVVACLVVFGGFVRLSESGLSIVRWEPVTGMLPPLNDAEWEAQFARYQESPEYKLVNTGMDMAAYKRIFLIEWAHRQIARAAGLFYLLPFLWFLWRGHIPRGERGVYFLMAALFVGQAVMGWLMVASGLRDRPAVSHFRLTAHLSLAILLFSLSLWTALGHRYGFPARDAKAPWSAASRGMAVFLAWLTLQIAYGGFVAGLDAGHVSATWPKMMGAWYPAAHLAGENWLMSPVAVMFVHRWLAFLGPPILVAVIAIAWRGPTLRDARRGLALCLVLIGLQIILGILTVVKHVHMHTALTHQGMGLALFGLALYTLHRLRAADRTPPATVTPA